MVVPRGGHDECGGTRCVFTFVMIGWRWTDPHYCYIINLITPLGSFIIAIRVAIAPLLTSRHDSTQFLCFFFLFSSSIFSFSLSLSLWDDGDTAETRKKSNRQTWRNWSLKKTGKKKPVKKPVGTSFFFSWLIFGRWIFLFGGGGGSSHFLLFGFEFVIFFFYFLVRGHSVGAPSRRFPAERNFVLLFVCCFLFIFILYILSLSLSLSLSLCLFSHFLTSRVGAPISGWVEAAKSSDCWQTVWAARYANENKYAKKKKKKKKKKKETKATTKSKRKKIKKKKTKEKRNSLEKKRLRTHLLYTASSSSP